VTKFYVKSRIPVLWFCLCVRTSSGNIAYIFFFELQVFVVAVLAIFPLVPRNLSQRAFRLSLMGTACSSLFSLYSLYGVFLFLFHCACNFSLHTWFVIFLQVQLTNLMLLQKPRAWNAQALQVYFQSIVATKDFIYFIYCLIFVASNLCLKCENCLVKFFL
jgi:hypothetical protein